MILFVAPQLSGRADEPISSTRKPAGRLHPHDKRQQQEETTMRKTVLTALGATLIALSMAQAASAAERHHVRKVEQFRNANNAVVVVQPSDPQIYSGGWSAPAGR
jgi:hypothetical protein